MRELELEDGKYRIVQEDSGYMACFRHDEAWCDLTGDKLVGALVSEVEELRKVVPAEQSLIQRADAWDAVYAVLQASGAIDPAHQCPKGKDTAVRAILALCDDAHRYRTWRQALVTEDRQFVVDMEQALPDAVGMLRTPTSAEWDAAIDKVSRQ